MWYCGVDDISSTGIGYATSTDGINWSKYPGNPVFWVGSSGEWDGVDISSPHVLITDTGYEMWYAGYDGSHWQIGHATSTDGTTWGRDPENPLLSVGSPGEWDNAGVSNPCVLYTGTRYEMFYTGNDGSQGYRIGYAVSTDGVNWQKYPENPVLDVGVQGEWDEQRVADASVLATGTSYKMWYHGFSADSPWYSKWRIGYASGVIDYDPPPPPVLTLSFSGAGILFPVLVIHLSVTLPRCSSNQ